MRTSPIPFSATPAAGCLSAPCVVGDRVFALFGRMAGGETHAVCLDRQTGAVLWTQLLGSGQSGRAGSQANVRRLSSRVVDAPPWGARPTLAHGELCVVPHAGFAAGLDPDTGAVRWLRATPRYAGGDDGTGFRRLAPGEGQSPRNVPVAMGDAWVLGPADSPELLAVTRGDGLLRWSRTAPSWMKHLLGPGRDERGRTWIRCCGSRPAIVDPATGAEGEALFTPWKGDPQGSDLTGRPFGDATTVTTAVNGTLLTASLAPPPARCTPHG